MKRSPAVCSRAWRALSRGRAGARGHGSEQTKPGFPRQVDSCRSALQLLLSKTRLTQTSERRLSAVPQKSKSGGKQAKSDVGERLCALNTCTRVLNSQSPSGLAEICDSPLPLIIEAPRKVEENQCFSKFIISQVCDIT